MGAASAPVALIIASSILLGNLGGRYAATMAVFRDLLQQRRVTKAEEMSETRRSSLERQGVLYAHALHKLMRASFWLTLSIQAFIVTVIITSVGVVFPQIPSLTWVTAGFTLLGLLLLAYSVAVVTSENRRTQECVTLEMEDLPN